jgi:hypothetical protein
VQKGLPKLGGRYKWLKTVIARADEVAQLGAPGGASALTDPRVTHADVAVREAKPPGGPRADPDPRRLWLVLVLGERR